jgi:hypothetical protein
MCPIDGKRRGKICWLESHPIPESRDLQLDMSITRTHAELKDSTPEVPDVSIPDHIIGSETRAVYHAAAQRMRHLKVLTCKRLKRMTLGVVGQVD